MVKFNPLDYPVLLEELDWTIPSAWFEHTPFAMLVIDILRPGVFVEVGSYTGTSYFAFCQSVLRLEIGTRCVAVNTWTGDAQSSFANERMFEALRAHNDQHYASFSTLLRMPPDEALAHFQPRSIDLLHLDGYDSLSYEAVKHDFEAWLPYIRKGGVVLFHDTRMSGKPDFGVWRLWNELRDIYPSFELTHGSGLGLIAVGDDYPEGLRHLIDAEGDELTTLQEIFYRLGRLNELQRQLVSLFEKGRVLQQTLDAQQLEIEALEHRIADMKSTIGWKVQAAVSKVIKSRPISSLRRLFSSGNKAANSSES